MLFCCLFWYGMFHTYSILGCSSKFHILRGNVCVPIMYFMFFNEKIGEGNFRLCRW